jgi:hypothetical protein
LQLEEIAEKLSRTFGYDHGVRLSDALQARRKVGRLADDCLLPRRTRSNQVADNDKPRRNGDTGL